MEATQHIKQEEQATLHTAFRRLHSTARAAPFPSWEVRLGWLRTLERLLEENSAALIQAVCHDFVHRSREETQMAELFPLREGIRYAKQQLRSWMRPQKRRVSHWFWPAQNRVFPQPLGIVGIVVPWNYPIYLALGPLTTALAAGNRVMIKMSEDTPYTGEVLQRLAQQYFGSELLVVVSGDLALAQAFVRLPFDHLFFTGSTSVGREVIQAASEHLTSLTLELGGKSPAIVTGRAHLKRAAHALVRGKMLNAGQTCVAPDYVLVKKNCRDKLIAALQTVATTYYPTLRDNPDYTAIINERHYKRLTRWIAEARHAGASVLTVNPKSESLAGTYKLPLTLIWDCPSTITLLQHEIFGPILPIITYEHLEEAIQYINSRPRPLALYLFTEDPTQVQQILNSTLSGGVAVNDTLLQIVQDDLPFGGVGASGWGHYHGREGFLTFSKLRSVFEQSRFGVTWMLRPPYGKLTKFLLKFMLK